MSKAQKALDIMSGNGLDVNDFAYGKSGFANYFVKTASGCIEEPGGRVLGALDSDDKWYSKNSPKKNQIINIIPQLRPILEELCLNYDKNISILNTADLLRENFRNFAMLTDLSRKIEEKCSSEGIMPISETNSILNKLVSGNDTPFIFEKAGNNFSRFMIDEFQDTSAMQWENFIPLLRNSLSQAPGDSVLLVGDVKQSIYRWRGGDWRILANGIETEFGEPKSENMATNYRSFGNVVKFNNELIDAVVGNDNTTLNSQIEAAVGQHVISADHGERLRDMLLNAYSNHLQSVPAHENEGYVNITCYNLDEEQKATPPIIQRVEELQRRGYRPSDIAILVRYNAEGVKIANMLLEHKRCNPDSIYSYDVVTQEALLIGSSPAVIFVCACFRLSYMPHDSLNMALYNQWFGHQFDSMPDEEEITFLASLRTMPPLEAFEHIVMRYNLGEKPEHSTYLQAFEEQIIDFGKTTVADIPLFLKWWDENGTRQSVSMSDNGEAITIITIHKAKGLQYKVVIIPYCDWKLVPSPKTILWSHGEGREISEAGIIPVKYKSKMKRSAFAGSYFDELVLSHVDNINTLYVATTRAEEELHIMIPDPTKSSADKIGTLIRDSITVSGNEARLGQLTGKATDVEYGNIVEFGAPVSHKTTYDYVDTTNIRVPFKAYGLENRLKIKYRASRYMEDGVTMAMSPRDYGILMHKVFESSKTREDIERCIAAMTISGEIQKTESLRLTQMITEAFRNPLIESWFSDNWDEVRNENAIIIPQDSGILRPDRVMAKGDKAIVVDYKFGLENEKVHTRQIKQYMQLIRRMGYNHTEGYIWYVSGGTIVKVE